MFLNKIFTLSGPMCLPGSFSLMDCAKPNYKIYNYKEYNERRISEICHAYFTDNVIEISETAICICAALKFRPM